MANNAWLLGMVIACIYEFSSIPCVLGVMAGCARVDILKQCTN